MTSFFSSEYVRSVCVSGGGVRAKYAVRTLRFETSYCAERKGSQLFVTLKKWRRCPVDTLFSFVSFFFFFSAWERERPRFSGLSSSSPLLLSFLPPTARTRLINIYPKGNVRQKGGRGKGEIQEVSILKLRRYALSHSTTVARRGEGEE